MLFFGVCSFYTLHFNGSLPSKDRNSDLKFLIASSQNRMLSSSSFRTSSSSHSDNNGCKLFFVSMFSCYSKYKAIALFDILNLAMRMGIYFASAKFNQV